MAQTRVVGPFEWDPAKARSNHEKHGVDFMTAMLAFEDAAGLIEKDEAHSKTEPRWLFFGKVDGRVLTVAFTRRGDRIRLISAGFFRKGKRLYESR